MPDALPPDEATRSAEPVPEVLSQSVPVPIPADAGAPTIDIGAGPDQAETADPDALSDHTADIHAILAPAQEAGELGRLGRYRAIRVLGRGGMGVVFEAEDEKLKRRVAIKAMLPALAANAAACRRFVREAETAAKVTDDHIVPIYDIAEANGVPFIAMPLLVGEPLDVRLKSGAIPLPDVLVIGREIALGLTAAHAVGLIHRDIKPGNVWLERTPEGAFKRTRILDFGLARLIRDGSELTSHGAILGTPAYMAPEQARGLAVDHRADLFSLGCVLYQMATGRRPFAGADTYSVLTSLATDAPAPPIEVNPAVPQALSSLIERLLTKNPEQRWPPTSREVAEELARITPQPMVVPFPVPQLAPRQLQATAVWSAVVARSTEVDAPVAGSAEAEPPKPKPIRSRGGRGPLYLALATVLGAAAVAAVVWFATQKSDKNATPPEMVKENPPKKDDPKPDPKAKPQDGLTAEQRKSLEWVLSVGGMIDVRVDEEKVRVAPGGKLPTRPFVVEVLWLNNVKVVDDTGIENLRACPPVTAHLYLNNTAITSAGMEKLASYPGFKVIRALSIRGTQVTDAGLAHLTQFSNLDHLDAQSLEVTDQSLKHLADCKSLRNGVDLKETKVTKAGVEKLAARRPDMPIYYSDGGLLKATATGTPVDLLALVDTKRDTVEGRWKLTDGKLVGGGTTFLAVGTERIQLPYTPQGEYDLVMVVQRTGVGKERPAAIPPFALNLTGPYRCQVILGHSFGEIIMNGLQLIDGKTVLANGTRTDGDLFGKNGGPMVLTCRVRKDGVTVLTDGQERFKWQGDVRKLDHDDELWKYPDKTRLALAVQYTEYTISEWKLYPHEAAAGAPGAAMPADNVFAGEVVLREPFDKVPKGADVGESKTLTGKIANGVYEVRWAESADGRPGIETPFGSAAGDTAFALRLRPHAMGYTVYFRPAGNDDRYARLGLTVRAGGAWEVVRETVKRMGEGWGAESEILKQSAAPDADLKDGKWVTLTVRSAGPTTEVWVNGRALTSVVDVKPPGGAPIAARGAVVFATIMPDRVACGFDLDYLVIWKPTTKPDTKK